MPGRAEWEGRSAGEQGGRLTQDLDTGHPLRAWMKSGKPALPPSLLPGMSHVTIYVYIFVHEPTNCSTI